MSTPRTDFAAVTLPNGKVLLIGGKTSPTTDTATVDIFDPTAGTVLAAASMGSARNGHSATLLPNGKVLVAGGDSAPDGGPTLGSAELYDLTTNTWTPAARMNQPRARHAAVLMSNGKVFVTGGEVSFRPMPGGFSASTPTGPEVYDVGTNTWSAAQSFYGLRPYGPIAIVLKDGRVMTYGGVQQVQPGNSYEFYDPATGQASYARFMGPGDTSFSTATLLGNGTVLIVGGVQTYNPSGPLSTTAIFDPAMDSPGCSSNCNSWSAGPVMNVGHCRHTMTTLRGGLILVVGGRCDPAESIAVAELYDPAGKRWLPPATMQNARGYHVAALLADGRVLVAGGYVVGGEITATTEIYTPA